MTTSRSGTGRDRRGNGRPGFVATVVLGLLALSLIQAAPVSSQGRLRGAEARLLREAAARESRGDYAGAEEALRRLLADRPGSSGGIFALERVLRAQGRVGELMPAIDAFLEVDPAAPGVRSLALRVLLETESLDALRDQARAWLELDPTAEVAYREISRVYRDAFGARAAEELLREGRETIGEDDVFALELGDVLVASGELEAAATEWAAAVGDDGGQTAAVSRRLVGLEEGGVEVASAVVDILAEADGLARRTAAARIALDLGLEEQAEDRVREVAGELSGRARASFLADAARRARDRDLVELASWAYDELGDEAESPAQRRQFDERIVEVALASGDTAAALEAQWRLVASYSPRSVDRRRATARAIELEGVAGDPSRLRDLLEAFRERFPEAPELDGLAARVASALHARGDEEGASAVLQGVSGPRSALEQGYLLLARGDLEEGRTALLRALTGLPPSEATSVIQFTGLMGRISEEGARHLAEAGVRAHRGEGAAGARILAGAVDVLPFDERPALLAEAARLASSGGEAGLAADIRARIVDEYPDAVESAEAALALARYRARTPEGIAEAVRLLEDLIARRPNAAVVPYARVELQRLSDRGGR